MSSTSEMHLEFYPPRLTSTDLDGMELLGEFLLPAAGLGKPLGDWLLAVATRERERRAGGEKAEADSPGLPINDWTDADIGNALMASNMMQNGASGKALLDLADRLHFALCVVAQTRLLGRVAE